MPFPASIFIIVADGPCLSGTLFAYLAGRRTMSPLSTMKPGVSAILEDAIAFLANVPPFQFLDAQTLERVAKSLSLEFYPKDTVILRQDGPPSDALRVIKKGSIKVSMVPEEGGEVVIDYRGEGDTFGFLSLVGRDRVRSNITAVEDTICYLVGKEMVLKLLDSHLVFTEYFLKTHITKYIDRTYQEMRNKSLFIGGSDRLLFTTRVGDIGAKEVVYADEDTPIQEAARLMTAKKISSLVVVTRDKLPAGIVTDRDLREKVVAKGRSVGEPVKTIMTMPLIRVDARDFCFEAVLKMLRYNIHHILVVKEGALAGVLTNHDLMMLQGSSPLSLSKDIESQQSVEGLVPASRKINGIVGLLLKEGAKAGNIIKIITEVNDRLVRKIIELTEKKLGRPPVQYCWIAFGSEGRKEQTFKTDQDNALIYADPADDEEARKAELYFAEFAKGVRDGLLLCGFPHCPADYMASNAKWRQPLKAWKRSFTDWVSTPTSEAVLHATALFDFRPMCGDPALADALRDHLDGLLKDGKIFLGHLANMAIKNRPPIGFLNAFVVEKDGEHKDELNLKVKGIALIVDLVRLFALERGVRETSTLERIDALEDKHTIVKEYADDLRHAFEFFMLFRIHHQYEQISAGRTPDNFINPKRLSHLERGSIKDAFHLISSLQDMVIERYKAMIW